MKRCTKKFIQDMQKKLLDMCDEYTSSSAIRNAARLQIILIQSAKGVITDEEAAKLVVEAFTDN